MGGGGGDDEDVEAKRKEDANIEIWKIKKLVRSLEAARGCVFRRLHRSCV